MERGCVEDQPQSLACMLRLVLRTQWRSENWNHDTAIGKATSQFVVASSLWLEIGTQRRRYHNWIRTLPTGTRPCRQTS